MGKPRLCFTLLYSNGDFCLSRNFKIQKVGNLEWIKSNYEFESISRSIDELVILNIDRTGPTDKFIEDIRKVIDGCFMPIAIGGGIRNEMDAKVFFDNGADKIVVNNVLWENPRLVLNLVELYGSQSIIGSLDFSRKNGIYNLFHRDIELMPTLVDGIDIINKLGVGELLINAIDQDGTGEGYDFAALEQIATLTKLPLIASGGGDSSPKLLEGIQKEYISAVTSSHLFNFMCDGLEFARIDLMAAGVELSKWDFEDLEESK